MIKDTFEIQYQSCICDSWFTYNIPINIVLEICIKKLDKLDIVNEYAKITEDLLKDPMYKAVRLLKVKKEVVFETLRDN